MVSRNRPSVGIELAKTKFFDRDIFAATNKAKAKALSKFGAYVRSDAKKSMKSVRGRVRTVRSGPRKGQKERYYKPAAAGSPPHAIEGLLKKFLFFVYEKDRDSVVIGPAALSNKSRRGDPVPGLHEHGGTQLVKSGRSKRTFIASYPKRPYMKPAGERNVRKLGDLFRDAIR